MKPRIPFQLKKKAELESSAFVPRAGVEPARVLPHWCLRPTRLPIPPPGQVTINSVLGLQR